MKPWDIPYASSREVGLTVPVDKGQGTNKVALMRYLTSTSCSSDWLHMALVNNKGLLRE